MTAEIAEGTVELKVKYKGTIYGLGFELKGRSRESLNREMKWLSSCLIRTLKIKGM
jgi:hypothetical protein